MGSLKWERRWRVGLVVFGNDFGVFIGPFAIRINWSIQVED